MHYREDFTPKELEQFKAELAAQDASPDDIEAAMEEAEYYDFLYSLPR